MEERITVYEEDKAVLIALAKNGSRLGDTLAELSNYTGFSTQRILAVAKRYDGRRFKSFAIKYQPPFGSSFSKASAGIANPRTGVSGSVPAIICIRSESVV